MSTPPQLPNSFRYFKAKLLSLGSPAVWIPALILTLVGAFGLEYATNPRALTGLSAGDPTGPSTSTLSETLTPEELRQAAEIDNIAVLSDLVAVDPEDAASLSAVTASNQETLPPAAGDRFLAEREAQDALAQAIPQNPGRSPLLTLDLFAPLGGDFGAIAGNSSNTNAANLTTNQQDALGNRLDNSTAPSSTARPSSLDQALGRNTSTPNEANANEANTATNDGTDAMGNSAAANSLPVASPLPTSFIRTAPTMSPPPGTTGYTQPQTLNLAPNAANPGNAYTNLVPQPSAAPAQSGLPLNSFAPMPSGTGSSSFSTGVPGSAAGQPLNSFSPVAPPAPFSAPRRSPGQYIGNGEFNTFSNP